MNIGIVTQPLSRNYGGILQNYALQQTLIKLGHTPYTFDLRTLFTWEVWTKSTIKNIIKCIIGRPYKFHQTIFEIESQEKILRSFVEKNISIIKPRIKRLTIDLILKNNIEAVIVGSDQVWRPKYNYCIEDMYLDFVKDIDVKKIAYAASFGTDEWEYTEGQTLVCKSLAQKFDAISVREKSGVDLCKNYLGVEALHLFDPTLLLTKEEYKQLLTHIPVPKVQYLFAYILDSSCEKIRYIKHCADEMGLEVRIKGADTNLSVDDSIENWLANFRDAKYVITDSFHGSVFSIIFNKPFITLGNKDRGMARFKSLLEAFELENRLIDLSENEFVSDRTIEWTIVNSKIEAFRNKSYDFLSTNL